GADEVERQELPVGHGPHAGEERHERAHDRDEPTDDDREAPVLFVEAVRALEVFQLEPAAEDRILGTMKRDRADKASDGVVDRIAEDRRGEQRQHQQMDVDPGGSDDRPGQKQQRAAGEQREDDEPLLRKDDDEQRREEQYGML